MDFTGPEMSFPQSYLINMLNNVRYAVPIERVSLSDKWRCHERMWDDQGSKTPGARGDSSAQEIPPQEKGNTAMLGVAQTGQTSTDRAVLEEAKAPIITRDTVWTPLVGGGG